MNEEASPVPAQRKAVRKALIPAVAIGVLIGAFAWAMVPDAHGVIHACYNTGTGALRVIDTETLSPIARVRCDKSEKALTWNQAGRDGIASAVAVHRDSTGPINAPGAPYVPIITAANVPAGGYVVLAKTVIFDPETDGGDCQLVYGASATVADSASHSPYKGTHASAAASYNLEAVVQLGAPASLVLQCRVGGSILRAWQANNSKLIVMKMQSVKDTAVAN